MFSASTTHKQTLGTLAVVAVVADEFFTMLFYYCCCYTVYNAVLLAIFSVHLTHWHINRATKIEMDRDG